MLLDLLGSVVLFFMLAFGLAWPLASRLALPPTEKLVATAALSLLGIFVFGWVVYVFALSPGCLWLLPVLAIAGLAAGRRPFAVLARDRETRGLFGAHLLITLWCLGWLATIGSYSGGGWAGDWFEHWERTRFFLERWPLETKILASYLLPARPPLANVVTGVFLRLSQIDFAHFQLVSTLLASLVFLPAALCARRWGGARAVPVLAVLFMLNPLFVQNATFAWTKLPAAFFVLAALWFFLRAHDADAPPAAGAGCGGLLAAGLLTHYSAGPYIVVLALWWLVLGRSRWRSGEWRRQTAFAAVAGAIVLALWFGWSVLAYGARGTFLSNSSVTSEHVRHGSQLAKIALNILDTLVPHFLRPMDAALIEQRSALGWWRDWFFQSYQLNLPLGFGSVAWLALGGELVRAGRAAAVHARVFWTIFAAGTVALGLAVHGARDHWGLAHICLQPLVLLGLAFLAARWAALSRAWRLALIAGATVDFTLGIALHFAVQNFAVARWLTGAGSTEAAFADFNSSAIMNFAGKIHHRLAFFGDIFAAAPMLVSAGVAAIFLLALARARAAARRHLQPPL